MRPSHQGTDGLVERVRMTPNRCDPDCPDSIPGLIRLRAQQNGARTALAFLPGRDGPAVAVSYGEIAAGMERYGALFQARHPPGSEILLALPQGPDLVQAFLGAIAAGTYPALLPEPTRPSDVPGTGRIGAILRRLPGAMVYTSGAGLAVLRQMQTDRMQTDRMQTDRPGAIAALPEPPAAGVIRPDPSPDAPACLQFTSGSTGEPRGVILTHANLLAGLATISEVFRLGPETVALGWLPPHHDMGLVGHILAPLYLGAMGFLAPPAWFSRDPLGWLTAIARYGVTASGGPPFAYDMLVRQLARGRPEDAARLAGLDLSRWSCAYVGAEPVSPRLLAAIAVALRPYGFRRTALLPCYGLAEATLLIAGRHLSDEPRPGEAPHLGEAPRPGEAPRLGEAPHRDEAPHRGSEPPGEEPLGEHIRYPVAPGIAVRIADPATGALQAAGEEGEIQLAGAAVSHGYHADPDANRTAFAEPGHWLHTGDLGRLGPDGLEITGRLKDIVIIRGVNHHAVDLEATARAAHPALHHAMVVAVALPGEATENLVIAAEVRLPPGAAGEAEIASIRRALIDAIETAHGILPSDIRIVRPGALPRTSSGKPARAALRAQLHAAAGVPEPSVRSCGAAATARPPDVPETGRTPGAPETGRAPGVPATDCAAGAPETARTPGTPTTGSGPGVPASDHAADVPVSDRTPGVPEPARIFGALQQDRAVAIIGMACRFPGADDPAAFWRRLAAGDDLIQEVPPDRWDAEAYYDPGIAVPGRMNTRWGGFIADPDRFDAGLFAIAPHEAAEMDPQQRLLLEVAWRAFEDAGLPLDRLDGSSTGVFIGISTSDYLQLQIRLRPGMERYNAYTGLGTAASIAANRLSFAFNLRGPSLAVDTACSSSLTAIHLASRALRNGECDYAIAGGVNLILSPGTTVALSQFGMMAPDGRCKVFDRLADGYVRSEGCGLVVLRRLADARRDRDRVHAAIRGSAIGQDGRTPGITAPNPAAQRWVIEQALADAATPPHAVGLIEAHGTGTAIGDPVEFGELVRLYGKVPGPACFVGSVKASAGHLEAAAGVASLIKIVQAIRFGAAPPQLHLHELNPRIKLAGTRLQIPLEAQPWPRLPHGRVAAISSFGFGGANAHMIVSEVDADPAPEPRGTTGPWLVPVSARDAEALAGQIDALAQLSLSPGDAAFTLGQHRTHFPYRACAVAVSAADLRAGLRQASNDLAGENPTEHNPYGDNHLGLRAEINVSGGLHSHSRVMADEGRPSTTLPSAPRLVMDGAPSLTTTQRGQCLAANDAFMSTQTTGPNPPGPNPPGHDPLGHDPLGHDPLAAGPVGFLFSGQGQQLAGMGRGLYRRFPVFRDAFDRCAAAFADAAGDAPPLAQIVFGDDPGLLDRAEYLQPALFAVSLATALLWRSFGVEPAALLGHSLGEITAAAVAGCFDPAAGMALVAARGRLVAGIDEPGAMAAVALDAAALGDRLDAWRLDRLSIAALNAPDNSVVSGPAVSVRAAMERLTAGGIRTQRLRTPQAFHSALMDDAAIRLESVAAGLSARPPAVPLIANLDGAVLTGAPDGAHWRRHLREPVRFMDGVRRLAGLGIRHLVEMGPGSGLLHLARRNWPDGGFPSVHPSLGSGGDDAAVILESAGRLYGLGARLDWAGVQGEASVQGEAAGTRRMLDGLPGHPFRRQRFWFEDGEADPAPPDPPRRSSEAGWVHTVTWDAAPLPETLAPEALANAADPERGWIIAGAGGGLGAALAARLAGPRREVFHLLPLDDPNGRGRLRIERDRAAGVVRLLVPGAIDRSRMVAALNEIVTRLAPLRARRWSLIAVTALDAVPTADLSAASLDDSQGRAGPGILTALMQAAVQTALGVRLWLVTAGAQPARAQLLGGQGAGLQRLGGQSADGQGAGGQPAGGQEAAAQRAGRQETGAQRVGAPGMGASGAGGAPGAVGADEPLALAQAPVWGFGQSLFLEHPEARGGLIDLWPDAGRTPAAAADAVLAAVLAEDGEPLCALRGGQRLVPRLTPAPLPPVRQRPALQAAASYLVTGGLGGLGLCVARWLAELGAGQIVLLSRRGLPPEDTWDDPALPVDIRGRIASVRALRTAGSAVRVVAADVRDEPQMRALFETLDADSRPVRGVVHAAGENRYSRIVEMPADQVAEALRTKVSAAWTLHALTRDRPMDLFVLFSSVSVIWGSVDLACYAAANAFLDALAAHRQALGLPATCIDWGPWSSVGMIADGGLETQMTRLGLRLLAPERCLGVMEGLVASGSANAVVMDLDWSNFRHFAAFATSPRLFAPIAAGHGVAATQATPGPHLATEIVRLPAPQALARLMALVRQELAAVVQLPANREPDPQERFNLMGMDSLMAIAFALRLEPVAGRKLPTTLAYNCPTILDVARHLFELIRGEPAPSEADTSAPAVTRRWFRSGTPPDPSLPLLFCLPWAGAGASVYTGWAAKLDGIAAVVAIQPPGREDRQHEPALTSMEALADAIAGALSEDFPLTRPFALFGHSLGGLVAFELARCLRRRGVRLPDLLCLSGCVPPPDAAAAALHTLPDEAFREACRRDLAVDEALVGNDSLWRSVLPVLRADLAVLETYRVAAEPALPVRTHVIGARGDRLAPVAALGGWSTLIGGALTIDVLDGGHMFVAGQADAVLAILRRGLRHDGAGRNVGSASIMRSNNAPERDRPGRNANRV
jgi:acyl transferase domain-containing protein/acyl-CoA synthetase (AMP-forming)/AMP-acid ligase II/surfactin synthase thioesterase subunit/NADP-dependent 3-hydroxy acid dehydrogenase YdfG